MKIKLHITFLLLLVAVLCSAQESMYAHFGVGEGLPSSEVYDVYQDKNGHIWFATDRGLSRYNGYEFKNYTTSDGLPGNTVLKFYPQINGQVWMYEYHSKSLFYFNELFDGFHLYAYNSVLGNPFKSNTIVKSVYLDPNSSINIGGYGINGRLIIDNKGNLKKYAFSADYTKYNRLYFDKKGLFTSPKEQIDGVYGINNDFLYNSNHIDAFSLNTQQDVLMYNGKIHLQSKNTNQELMFNNQVLGIKRINDKQFFAGIQSGGGMIVNNKGAILRQFLSNKSVSNFLIDHEDGYWFTTLGHGVYYIKNPKIKTSTEENISSLVKNNKDELYIGFNDGNVYKKETTTLKTLHESQGKMPVKLDFDSFTNNVYGLSDFQLINFNSNEKHYLGYVTSLTVSTKLPKLIGARSGVIWQYKNQLKRYDIPNLMQDAIWYKQNILIATNKGLLLIEGDSVHPYNNTSQLFKTRIDDIDNYKNGFLMATQGNGVVIYDDILYNVNKDKGLSSNIVNEVHIENDNTIWACTNTGLNRIKLGKNQAYSVNIFNKDNGLISNEVTDVEIIKDTIWVGTKQGLCSIPMDVFEDQQSVTPNFLRLERLVFNEKLQNQNEKFVFPYGDNTIDFYIQAISFKNDINYKFRIKELNEKWNTTINRKISFPSLPAGNYTFEAKACINSNCSEELISVSFKIQPPYWNRWWFYMLCFSGVLGLIYIFFKVRVLTYNKDVTRELIRLIIKRLNRKETYLKIRSNGADIKISTRKILYVKSHSNYLDVFTDKETYTYRQKIGEFENTIPEPLEFIRVHRSYIVRIDQIASKGKNWVLVKDKKIPVGETYLKELDNIQF